MAASCLVLLNLLTDRKSLQEAKRARESHEKLIDKKDDCQLLNQGRSEKEDLRSSLIFIMHIDSQQWNFFETSDQEMKTSRKRYANEMLLSQSAANHPVNERCLKRLCNRNINNSTQQLSIDRTPANTLAMQHHNNSNNIPIMAPARNLTTMVLTPTSTCCSTPIHPQPFYANNGVYGYSCLRN